MEEAQNYTSRAIDLIMEYGPNLVLAIVVLMIGFWVVKRLSAIIEKSLRAAKLGDEITPFLISLTNIGLKVLLLFSVAGIVGIETSSFVALLAAAGFAIGMALQGSLGNFAAGVIILIFKPYKVGDWVEIQEKFGKIEEIQIFNTIVSTPGNKTHIVPNGQVIDGIITNLSNKEYIRLELKVSMPYEESYPKVKQIITRVLESVPNVIKTPVPEIGIVDYDSHNIVLAVRPYIKPDNYWEVTFEAYEKIKAAFHENNIKVAYSEGVELGPIGA
ncbi:MAG TPA: mechanosensitive ion channel [Oceanospirillales bacterium]|nr:mechanosensitive ion channel [Oceanospirillales bacterium]